MTMECEKLGGELSDKVFLTCILVKKSSADIQAAATTSQRLSEAFQKSIAIDKNPLLLLAILKVLNLYLQKNSLTFF